MKKLLLSMVLLLTILSEVFSQCSINVGADKTVCSQDTISLFASSTGGSGYNWQSTGTGNFIPNNQVANPRYILSNEDKAAGSVLIMAFLADETGSCGGPKSDTLKINYLGTAAPKLTTSIPTQACYGRLLVLDATVQNATGVQWSVAGAGTLSNPSSLNPTYTFAPSDSLNKFVIVLAKTTGNGNCPAKFDSVKVNLVWTPYVDAGPDMTVCYNGSGILLAGYSTNRNSSSWSTGGGVTGTIVNLSGDSAFYYPSAADITAGSASLVLTAQSICGPYPDLKTITFVASPIINAGQNLSLHSGSISLNGMVANAGSGVWVWSTVDGSGMFTNPTSLNTTYIPSAGDLAKGIVILKLTTSGNGSCADASDQITLTSKAVICNANFIQVKNDNTVTLSASNTDNVTVGNYVWNFGDGTFGIGKIQSHTYSAIGSYNVGLIYYTSDSLCTSTKDTIINITAIPVPTYEISGEIQADGIAFDTASVTLHKSDGTNYKLLQSVEMKKSDNGKYTFSKVPEGEYIIFVIPASTSIYAKTFEPTYNSDVTDWKAATKIKVIGEKKTANIALQKKPISSNTTWDGGSDNITGSVTFSSSAALKVTAGASINPVQFAVVTLYDDANNKLGFVSTDQFGNYKFVNVAQGNYKIKIEYPGGTTENAFISLQVDGNASTTTVVDTYVNREQVTTSISTLEIMSDVLMYPNPVNSVLNIKTSANLSGTAKVVIYNAMGRMINNYNRSNSEGISIDVSGLTSGMYYIEVIQDGKIFRNSFVKY